MVEVPAAEQQPVVHPVAAIAEVEVPADNQVIDTARVAEIVQNNDMEEVFAEMLTPQ